jgi:hypothetical protein
MWTSKPSTQMEVEAEEEVVVKAKVVADLEIRILDNIIQMTHSNNSHTEVVEEASLKAGGAKEDVAIGTDKNLDQILETVIIVANQAIGPENVERTKVT